MTTYHLQAGIAAIHAIATHRESTDWPRLLELYSLLVELEPSPIVRLNRAVALAMVAGTAVGLAAIHEIEASPAMNGYFPLHATRADFLRKLGRIDEAEVAYHMALGCARTEPERRFLLRRLSEIASDSEPLRTS